MTLSEIYITLENKDFKTVTNEVKKLNKSYREGDPLITDPEYDKLINTIKLVDPENEIFESGIIETVEVDSDRKETLKYPMFSLDKESSIEDIQKWLINKGLPLSTTLICTAKYDGISILKDEWNQLAWSRGDGVEGETVHEHYKKLNDNGQKIQIWTIGEMIIPKPVFASRTFYRDNGEAFKNARNMIAGLKNNDKICEDLKYATHVRYGFANEDFKLNKSEQLDFISANISKIEYKYFRADELNIDELNKLFIEWGKEYDIDGLVFDIDDKEIRKKLGRERNNNPSYARAFKNPEWAERSITKIIDIEWNISKQGYIKPVAILEPIELEGVTISRVTLNNAKFVKDNDLGVGSEVVIIRSGMVIPKIVDIIKATGFKLPILKNTVISWNENNVELCVSNDCNEVKFKKLAFFFERFKITGFAEKTIKKFYDSGYNTVAKILAMTSTQIQNLEGMGNLSASKLLKEFDEKVKSASFDVIGHASGCFENIGSRKLKMIVDGIKEFHADSQDFMYFQQAISNMDLVLITNILSYKSIREEIANNLNLIKGMSNKTSESFLDGLVNFKEFMSELEIEISDEPKTKKEKEKNKENINMKNVNLTGREFVFTGFRDAELKTFIEECGGIVKDGITKNTTDLLTKNEDSTSAKAVKAKSIGANVTQVDIFKNSVK